MIFDSFMYCGEDDLLEIHLEEMWDLVDRFIITESQTSFTGMRKKMYFKSTGTRFNKYRHKILYIESDMRKDSDIQSPFMNNARKAEWLQRDYFLGLFDFHDDDILIIGDIDEIPNIDTVKKVLPNIRVNGGVCMLIQSLYYYYINCAAISSTRYSEGRPIPADWRGPFIIDYGTLKMRPSPSWWRDRKGSRKGIHRERNGGWHFSYLGGAEKIKRKIDFSFDGIGRNLHSIEHVRKCLNSLADLYPRAKGPLRFRIMNDDNLPRYLLQNKDKFSHLFYNEENKT